MRQPLVLRPGYGEGRPATPVAEAKLPEGGPTDRGLPLDSAIPGSQTYTKPLDDTREQGKDDEPIQRVEDADDLTKDRSRIDTREDNAHADIGYSGLGGRDPDDASLTKYPYRDGIPNSHSASTEAWVLQLWGLRHAHILSVPLGGTVRLAARLDEVLDGLNEKVEHRAKACSVNLKRVDRKNLRWLFAVDCGNGTKAVKLHADRVGNVVKLTKMHVSMSCSCKAWRWLGSEHHSKREDYLDGRPRGTATPPLIKDPEMKNRVCKHVMAVLSLVRDWEIPNENERK